MARLILLVALVVALVLALSSIMVALRAVSAQTGVSQGNMTMPKTFQTIAYVLLLVLMMGIASGWIGGL